MIVQENIKIRNKDFVKTYSDAGFYIERDGIMYAEAIDSAEFERVYTETDVPIEEEENASN